MGMNSAEQLSEGQTVQHRWLGPVVIESLSQAYQGMLYVRTESGARKPVLLGDVTL
jgi:hypothetical protein